MSDKESNKKVCDQNIAGMMQAGGAESEEIKTETIKEDYSEYLNPDGTVKIDEDESMSCGVEVFPEDMTSVIDESTSCTVEVPVTPEMPDTSSCVSDTVNESQSCGVEIPIISGDDTCSCGPDTDTATEEPVSCPDDSATSDIPEIPVANVGANIVNVCPDSETPDQPDTDNTSDSCDTSEKDVPEDPCILPAEDVSESCDTKEPETSDNQNSCSCQSGSQIPAAPVRNTTVNLQQDFDETTSGCSVKNVSPDGDFQKIIYNPCIVNDTTSSSCSTSQQEVFSEDEVKKACSKQYHEGYCDGFKAGYEKAKEEVQAFVEKQKKLRAKNRARRGR